jgi:phage/plasmid-like protein (TIGR03299 family)
MNVLIGNQAVNRRTKMSHEIESIAYAHETPWHGIGVNVSDKVTVDEMIEAAGLNWEVERVPTFTMSIDGQYDPIPNRVAVRRATDKYVYDIVSPRWKPVQNREILEFFREWAEAGDATLETAGSLRNGRNVWALANLGNNIILPGGDKLRTFVLLMGSHEAGKSTIARDTTVRVVCANTLAMALGEEANKQLSWSHAKEFDREVAKAHFAVSRERTVAFEKAARTLQKLKLDMTKIVKRWLLSSFRKAPSKKMTSLTRRTGTRP